MESGVGHLYHDADLSNNFTSLDVKDKLRTKQAQAREGKQLEKLNRTLQRAHTVLVKRQDWERNNIEQDLHLIKLRTLSLNKSLKKEREDEKKAKEKLPLITKSSNSLVQSYLSENSSNGESPSSGKSSLRRLGTISSTDLRYSAEVIPLPKADKEIPEDLVSVYMKKADVVARNLHRLYKKKEERNTYIKEAVEIMKQQNQDLITEAKFYARNQSLLQDGEMNSKRRLSTRDHTPGARDRTKGGSRTCRGRKYKLSEENVENEMEFHNDTTGDGDAIKDTKKSSHKDFNILISPPSSEGSNSNASYSPVGTFLQNGTFTKYSPEIEPVSSVLANPSEFDSDFDDKHAKWTDIFKIPEMWKVFNGRKKEKGNSKPSHPSLVTIRGKLRKTLIG